MSLRVEEWKKDEHWFQCIAKLLQKQSVKVLRYFHSMSTFAKYAILDAKVPSGAMRNLDFQSNARRYA